MRLVCLLSRIKVALSVLALFAFGSFQVISAQTTATGKSASRTHVTFHAVSRSTWASLGVGRAEQRSSSRVLKMVDAQGRLVKVIEPDAAGNPKYTTEITYNGASKVASITQHGARGDRPRIRTFTYDAQGRVLSSTSPEAGLTTFTYDSSGNLLSRTDNRDNTTTYTWDASKHLIGKQYTDGTSAKAFTFTADHRMQSSYVDSLDGQHTAMREYEYDSKGRLTRLSIHPIRGDGPPYTVRIQYDATNHVSSITYPDGRVASQGWNKSGQLQSITTGNETLFSRPTYAADSGHIESAILGNALLLQNDIDGSSHRITGLHLTSASHTVLDQAFAYTSTGSLSKITDKLHPEDDTSYKYDQLGRVQSAAGAVERDFVYDAFGNLAMPMNGQSAAFDAGNHFTGHARYSYDAAGNMTFDGVHRYAYDGDGQILSVDDGAIHYAYDAEGNRVQKVLADGSYNYIWFDGRLLAEQGPGGNWIDYFYAGGDRIASIAQGKHNGNASEVRYYVTGPLGVTRLAVSPSGEEITSGIFAPFGDIAHGETTASNISIAGEVHDPETDLDTYKYRSYNRRLGRWMSADPSSLHFGRLDNPQTFNLYAYVTNDPLKYIDVQGLCAGDGTGDDDGDCYLPPYDPCEDGNCGGGDGGGGDGGGGSGDPCAYSDACVIADPDPPVGTNPSEGDGDLTCYDDGSCEADEPPPSTYHQLPSPDANHTHTLTLRQVSGQGGNPAGHVTVQLDSRPEVGFGPAQSMSNSQLLQNTAVPGTVEARAAGTTTIDAVTVYLTDSELAAAQSVIDSRTQNPGNYQVIGNSCVDFGEAVLSSTGAPAPSDLTPSWMISDIRSRQYADNTVQAP